MKKIKRIIIHHSASEWGNAFTIDKWHKEKGWSGIGYHWIINNGYTNYSDYKNNRKFYELIGSIECGRTLDADEWIQANEKGAHAYGYNSDSIGICLIHKTGKYHKKMLNKLFSFLVELIIKFNIDIDNIVGHCELDSKKPECPSIDMEKLRNDLKNHFEEIDIE